MIYIYQLLLAFAGGSLAIYIKFGDGNGYAIGAMAFVTSYLGTVLLVKLGDLRYRLHRRPPRNLTTHYDELSETRRSRWIDPA